jgi:hypothetical protein
MKNLDLNNYGVQEMNAGEMREIEGGLANLVWFAIGLIASELLDRNAGNDFRAGYQAAM